MIHVCSLAKIEETVARSGADRMLSLLAAGTAV
ncbi:protein tyrosine phosphatase, partial [Mesorhizobium sp. M7A.F.Ca.CA.004.06.1.1]